MKIYKQLYVIFVLLRACLWDAGISFERDGQNEVGSDHITGREITDNMISSAGNDIYMYDGYAAEHNGLLRTQTNKATFLPVLCRDVTYNRKSINGEYARFLRQLLFPNHSFD